MSEAAGQAATGCVDEWFIDDGQGVVRAEVAERWLLSVDMAIADIGGSRGTGRDCKSVPCLCVQPEREHEFAGWASGHIGD